MVGALLSLVILTVAIAPTIAVGVDVRAGVDDELPAAIPIEATSDMRSFRYSIEASASIAWRARRVAVIERILFENVGELPIGSVNLLSLPRGLRAWKDESVFVDGEPVVATHPTQISIGVAFPAPLAPGGRATIELRGTIFPDRADDAFGRLGWDDGLLNLGQWLALPDRPQNRSTVGDPISAIPADQIVTSVLLDRTLDRDDVQASGELLDGPERRGRSWTFSIERARAAALLVDPDFRIARRTVSSSGVAIIGASRSIARARWLAEDARLAIGPYTRWFGDPPWGRLRVIDAPRIEIAQEYPGLIVIGDRIRSRRYVVWHETAHQWWYGLVANDQRSHPWVDEALAEFAASLRSGASAIGGCSTRPIDLGSERYGGFFGCGRYYESVYRRGAAMLFSIRRAIGEAPLLACLRAFVERNRFARATGPELARALGDCDPAVPRILSRYLRGPSLD